MREIGHQNPITKYSFSILSVFFISSFNFLLFTPNQNDVGANKFITISEVLYILGPNIKIISLTVIRLQTVIEPHRVLSRPATLLHLQRAQVKAVNRSAGSLGFGLAVRL